MPVLVTEPLSEHMLTSRAVGVGIVKAVFGSGFVDIDAVFGAQCGERRDKGRALLGVAFSVAIVFFCGCSPSVAAFYETS